MFLVETGLGIHYLQTPLVVRLPGRVVPLKLNSVLNTGWWVESHYIPREYIPIESNNDLNQNQVVQFFSSYFHLDHRTYHQNQQDTHLRSDGTPLSRVRKTDVRKHPTPPHHH